MKGSKVKKIKQVQEQIISTEQTMEGPPKKPAKGAIEIHLPNCRCTSCRSYYAYSKGEVKKIIPSLYSIDRIRTLDCCEYIESKDQYVLMNKLREREKNGK